MKKLLGILGTITIAGSGMSGIVGNAPASAIKSEINYLQANNLKILNREKRQINNLYAKNIIKDINYSDFAYKKTRGKWNYNGWNWKKTPRYYINILDYNENWNDFKQKYKKIKINLEGFVQHSKAKTKSFKLDYYLDLNDFDLNAIKMQSKKNI